VDVLEFLLVCIAGLIFGAAVVAAVVAYRRSAVLPSRTAEVTPQHGRVVVLLDVERVEPQAPASQRLVREAAARMFRMMPGATEVEVRSAAGVVLGVVPRARTVPPPVLLPDVLVEPHTRRSRTPDPSRHFGPEVSEPRPVVAPVRRGLPLPESSPARPFADRFDLPEKVRARLVHPNDPVGIVRAILDSAGIEVQCEGDLLLADGVAIVVIVPTGVVVHHELLNHAFIRIERSGAGRGVVIGIGVLDVGEVRRREAAAPHVLHAGPEAIQRMADAVAIGADPLRFAAAPALSVLPHASGSQ
jgi:hypothetical protein